MILKKNYSFNIIKHARYIRLEKALFVFTLKKKALAQKQMLKKTPSSCLINPFLKKKNSSEYLFSNKLRTICGAFYLDKYQNQLIFSSNKEYGQKKIQTKFQSIVKDQKKRAAFAQNELKKIILKAVLIINYQIPLKRRPRKLLNKPRTAFTNEYIGPILFLDKTLNKIFTTKTRSFSRIRNRCLLTGHRAIVGKFRLGRVYFRQYASSGWIPGLVKNKN